MKYLDKFKYIMTSKDYDFNVLCISLEFDLYNERNILAIDTVSNI